MVVRLNRPQYDKDKFVKAGIKHMDLYFLDGSTPKDVRFWYIKLYRVSSNNSLTPLKLKRVPLLSTVKLVSVEPEVWSLCTVWDISGNTFALKI